MPEIATVHSENSGSVKMRAKPSTSCNLYWDVPDGAQVDLLDWGDQWSRIEWSGQEGYMMSKFLVYASPAPNPDPWSDDCVMVPREELLQAYHALGKIMGMTVERG